MVIQKYYFNIKQNYGVNLLCLLLVISTNLELVKSVNCVLEPWFIQDDSFANLWNTQGRVNGYDGVENRLHCSAKCQRLDACVSFFYNPKTSKCQVNSVIYLSKAGQVTTVGATYFRKYKGKNYTFYLLYYIIYIHTFIHACKYTYIHTYMYIHTYTHA